MHLIVAAYGKLLELLNLIVGAPMALLVRLVSLLWQPTKDTAGRAPEGARGRPRKGKRTGGSS